MDEQPVIQLTGDALDGAFWTWEVHGDASPPRVVRLDAAGIAASVARFRDALPHTPTQARRPQHHPAHAALTGELSCRESEHDLMGHLGRSLLPDQLLADVRRLARDAARRPQLRVAPSPGTAAIPWSLLRTDPQTDERLGELVDLVRVAPLLVRDLDGTPPAAWDAVAHLPCLHIIDPIARAPEVVPDELNLAWTLRPHSPECRFDALIDRTELSDLLRQPRSRLFYVGHAIPTGPALNLGDPDENSATDRPFTAFDLMRGTLGSTTNTPQTGREVWPMPNRVALIGCATGTDMAAEEPFGLVTSVLEGGAELVTATLWPLLTDYTYRRLAGVRAPVLTRLALEIDDAHQSDDPMTALREWELERLTAWRSSGRIEDSPLLWGSIATYHAPNRNAGAWLALD